MSNPDPPPMLPISKRITLSAITWNDKPAYLKHLNETEEFHRHMTRMPFPYRQEDADQWLTLAVGETLEKDRSRSWAIRKQDGELIGGVSVFDMTVGEKAEIGYWLAQPYWGQGIATEMVIGLSRFAFQQYELQRIYAQVFSINPASARVLEKAGFQKEGTLRRHVFRDGQTYDMWVYGLLRSKH